ncbi:type IV pilus biogenesis/stability protein PilW [Methylophaga nitratireducenticrescens]|uniref:Type IV pilus biogenesis protein PilF n=1 Tax=Methylophaga nitratireducenticrescens TaxID=754476 RepID=I1XLT6_METNJ|nr:type IV pilus biogenesis/stability protein PilW [Methylophaga nitratireducenticrescens]AFI85355.1 type IV pilus biogenesis/stability protein PilW [Methylophaga nitratireducenticrescens]AUZ85119.1 type IV pilus biogenesis/stability protein PilW [Methylophaga nitratireducenticrescens]
MKSYLKIGFLAASIFVLSACGTTGPREHIAPDPKAAELNMQLGLSYLQRGDYEIAMEKLNKALKQNPNLPSAHNTIALLYQRLGEKEKAENHFKEAVSRAPEYSEAQNNYGVFLCQQGKYEDAEQRFLIAVENPLYQSAAMAYENAALCTRQIPDLDRAEAYFRRALQINPNLSKSLMGMADLSYEQGDYMQARAYVQRFSSVSPWTPQALLTAIKTESKLGNQDAVSSYKLIMRARFPDSDEMRIVNEGI